MTNRRRSLDDDLKLILGQTLERVEQLQKDVDAINAKINWAIRGLIVMILAIIAYFWHHPEAWLRLAKFLQ